ncbi:MAG: outer membrane lipoprotein carrier protein LolA [Cytophagaceae bacterium]|jgi:outer membrane lipoprotein-sorting protein|nr:outer membrane lipoprotein carrier protein LolA [Cytophagaceae bacterium]
MKTLVSVISIFAFATLLCAQSPDVLKAKAILDKVAEKTKTYSTIRADFSITLENKQANITDTYQGKIILKGNKYKAEIMNTETFYDGKTIWSYLPDANEVNVSDPSMMEDELLDPASIFTIYDKNFKYIYAGETSINGKKADIVDLFPENRDKPYSRIKVYVYKDNLQFAKLVQIGKDGNNYIIDIKKMEINVPADDSMFKFDETKHPGVEVIDMR